MKKILTFLMLLCTCMGAWAQTFSAGKHYTFQNKGNSSYVCYDASVTSGGNTILAAKNIGSAFLLEGTDAAGYKIRLAENPDLYVFAINTNSVDSNVGIRALGTDTGNENKYIWRIENLNGGFCITPKTGDNTWASNAWNRRGTVNNTNTLGLWVGNASPISYAKDDNTWYICPAIEIDHAYTVKAHFTGANQNDRYLTHNSNVNLQFTTEATPIESYWIFRSSGNNTRPWKLQSSYNDGKYLDGNTTSGLSDNGLNVSIDKVNSKGDYFYLQAEISAGTRYLGTWCPDYNSKIGFGTWGGCYGTSHSSADWTTNYVIEEISTSYLVESNLTVGGVSYTSSYALGNNTGVTRGNSILTFASSIQNSELSPISVEGYDANVTIDEANKRIKVTYTFKEGLYNLKTAFTGGSRYGVVSSGTTLKLTTAEATPDAFIIVPSGKTNATVNQPTYYIKNTAGTYYLTYDANLGSQTEVLILDKNAAGITWENATPTDGFFAIVPLGNQGRALAGKPANNLGYGSRTLPTVYYGQAATDTHSYSWSIEEDQYHAYYTINCTGLQHGETGGVCYNRVDNSNNRIILPVGFDKSTLIAMHVSGYNGSVSVDDATKTITVTYSTEATAGPTLWPDNNNSTNLPAARIPAIVKSGDYILAFSDWRYNRNDIGRGDNGKRIDIEMRRSHDNGQTWEPAIIVAQGTGVTADGYSAAHGDAAVVADRESGKVLMMAASGNTTDFSGSSSSNRIKIGKFTSSDNGANWTKSEVTDALYDLLPETVTKIFVTSGKILQGSIKKEGAANYRIYAVLCTNEGNHVIYSDNFGETWGRLGNACTAGNEAHVTELPNGDLLLDSRAGGARYVNVYTYANKQDGMAVLGDSDEQGAWGTYGTMGIPTSGDGCNGDIDILTAYPKGSSETVKVLLQTSPRSGRNNVSYYYMRLPEPTNGQYNVSDFVGAAKWTSGYEVFHGASAYSSIFHDEQGDVHMLLEKNTTGSTWSYNMTYEKHNISLITNGNYFSVDPTGEKTIKYTLTDVNGATYEGETTGTMGTAPAFTGCDGIALNKASWGMEGEKATYTANVVFPFPISSNNVENWTYIGSFESGNHLWFAKNGGLKLDIDKMPTNDEQVNNTYKWAIYPENDGLNFSFKIKNAATNTYLASANTSTSSAFALAQEGYAYTYKTHLTNKKGFYYDSESKFITFNSSAYGGEQNAWLWSASGSHNGSNLKFVTPTDFNALMEQLQDAITCPGTEGTKVGQYSASGATEEQKTHAQDIINGREFATAAQFQELTSAISYTLNMPQPGHFYRFKGVATGKYVTCTNARYNNNDNVYEMAADKTTGDNVKNTIIYYGTDNKLVMYGTGYGFDNGMQASLDANTTFTFQADTQGAVGKYNIKGVYGSSTIYLWNYSTNIARNGSVTPECVWELEEVETLPLTIGSTGFATFYTPVTVAVPAAITPYVCNLNGEDLAMYTCKQKTNINGTDYIAIPARTAVMIKATSEGTKYLSIVDDSDVEAYDNNSFFGDVVTKPFAEDYTYYSLQRDNEANDGTVGFFIKPSGNFKGFQAFLKTSTSQASNRLNIHFEGDDVATGIIEVLGLENANIPAYDLSGRRVNANSRNGFYIVNGKKIIK